MSHINIASSKHCSTCGGEVDGFKCPECKITSAVFDPSHWRACINAGKMKLKCKKCGMVEINCTC
ncbi:MAG: hypothetical protein QY304_02720 [Candidatus Paceibacterota bacterium]|nr:MAG: hypothetical protein QY304_02720 [Candidatus Paceibacterota bacterium]